ncbi:uncharacterized protein LOC134222838 [Armigeres subalbatus]|uniref:uncharacterized protein LOC134222838 n=1 Tax=Armigeres subalbatus TaxID=124917 RepID=UPI002ED46A54
MVDLNAFSDYMGKVTAATSGVTNFCIAAKPTKDEKVKSKDKAFVNAHATYERKESEQSTNAATSDRREPSKNTRGKGGEANKFCPMCNGHDHTAATCAAFKKLSVDGRWNFVKDNKLCRRCLISHNRWPCEGEVCGINSCEKRHHRLLHSEPAKKQSVNSSDATVTIHRQPVSSTLFKILPVTLYGKNGSVNTFAFLDDGSSATLVEQTLANELGVSGSAHSLCIHWTSGINKRIATKQLESLSISEPGCENRLHLSEVYTVENLGLPEQSLDFEQLAKEFKHLRNLPVKSFHRAVPGLLIGLSNSHLLTTTKLREGNESEPVAAKTRIGWVVCGQVRGGEHSFKHRQMYICTDSPDQDLHDYVREFFSVESLGVSVAPNLEGDEDQRARRILEEKTIRTADGKYETGLLWKEDSFEFPDIRPMAERRLKCLERRLEKDPQLCNSVHQQVADYESKGYIHVVTKEEMAEFDPQRTWYLPLGVVLNPNKPGKVRVIWDAAAKVSGVSLNTTQYVAFRVNEVLNLSKVEEWRWLGTKNNVADEATKWGKGPNCNPESRWMCGPAFLYEAENDWPKHKPKKTDEAEELRPAYVCSHLLSVPMIDLSRFSKYERLLRSVAHMFRFIEKLSQRIGRSTFDDSGTISRENLRSAEEYLWRLAQSDCYSDEVATLKRNMERDPEDQQPLCRSSPLVNLPPVMDEHELMRVDGRIGAADCLEYDAKVPVILPRGHPVTDLLLEFYHRKFRHANNETVVNEIRQKFYIPRLRTLIRTVAKRCQWCRVYRAKPVVPKMSQLPRFRSTPFVRPFTFVGIDYFGPYFVKNGRSAVKRWVAIFTCLTVRAIHLELVYALSTDSCKKAVRRFIARRGAPQEVYTDNGTNFIGASRELEDELRSINGTLSSTFTDANTKWRFNPPLAPHMGGWYAP